MEHRKKIDEGGPAFPVNAHNMITDGINLRDYFAAQALPAVIQVCRDDTTESSDGDSLISHFAKKSYELADAMLKARKAVPPCSE